MPKIKEIEKVPHENAMLFVLDRELTLGGVYHYRGIEEAKGNDMVSVLLSLEHVIEIQIESHNVIVFQDGQTEWAPLLAKIAPFVREAVPLGSQEPGTQTTIISRRVIARELRSVIDPELGVNIIDLGLVYNITQNDDLVTVEFTATTPGCPMRRYLQQHVESALEGLEIRRYEAKLVWEPNWSIEMMAPTVDLFSTQKSRRWII